MEKVWVLPIVVALCLAGCRGVHRPRLQGPGTAESQRQWAQIYDPYPEGEVGPDVMGGRPRDFDVARAEPQRARIFFQSPYERSRRRSPY